MSFTMKLKPVENIDDVIALMDQLVETPIINDLGFDMGNHRISAECSRSPLAGAKGACCISGWINESHGIKEDGVRTSDRLVCDVLGITEEQLFKIVYPVSMTEETTTPKMAATMLRTLRDKGVVQWPTRISRTYLPTRREQAEANGISVSTLRRRLRDGSMVMVD